MKKRNFKNVSMSIDLGGVCLSAFFQGAHVEVPWNNGKELEPHILGNISPNWVNILPKYGAPTPSRCPGPSEKAHFFGVFDTSPPNGFEKAHVEAVRNNGRELEPHILGKISPNWVNVFPKYGPPTPSRCPGPPRKVRFFNGVGP